jgi:hypothetical protein
MRRRTTPPKEPSVGPGLIDTEALDYWLRVADVSNSAASRAAGANDAFVGRIRRGESGDQHLSHVVGLIRALHVPLHAICPWASTGPDDIQHCHWRKPSNIERYSAFATRAKHVLKIHRGLDSWLLPLEAALDATRRNIAARFHRQDTIEDVLGWQQQSWRLSVNEREHSDYHQRIVAPAAFIESLTNPEWVEGIRKTFDEHSATPDNNCVTLALLPEKNFELLVSRVARFVPVPNWTRIAIIGDRFATFGVGLHTYVTYHHATVLELLAVLERTLAYEVVPHSFPDRDSLTFASSDECNRHAMEFIDRRLRVLERP